MKASKIRERTQFVKLQMDVENHRIFNALALAIKNKMEAAANDKLLLAYGGKSIKGNVTDAALTGTITTDESTIVDNVKRVLESLKNPVVFQALLK